MKDVLVIKTEALLTQDRMKHFQKLFVEQLKTGVVLIPAYFDAKIIQCPDDVQVVVESVSGSTMLDKEFNFPKE